MMMSTLDLSDWLVFLFLPWYMRKSAVSMRATLQTSTWVPILNKTLPRNHLRVWQALRNLCHLLQSPLTPVRLQPLDAVARAQHPLFRSLCSNAQFIPSPGVKAMEWKPRSLGRISWNITMLSKQWPGNVGRHLFFDIDYNTWYRILGSYNKLMTRLWHNRLAAGVATLHYNNGC